MPVLGNPLKFDSSFFRQSVTKYLWQNDFPSKYIQMAMKKPLNSSKRVSCCLTINFPPPPQSMLCLLCKDHSNFSHSELSRGCHMPKLFCLMSGSVIVFSTLIVGGGVGLNLKTYDGFQHFHVLPKIFVTDCLKMVK